MHLRTLLNHADKLKGFVYENDHLADDGRTIEVRIRPRAGNRGRCAKCGMPAAGYDRLSLRRFQYIPFGPFAVRFLYEMRRVSCPVHGVTVEQVPWAKGKSGITVRLSWFLARWAKRLSWQEVALVFEVNWRQVFMAVKMAVDFGLKNRTTDGVQALGVDEVQCGKGHEYMTLVYEIGDGVKRLLYVGKDRTLKSLLRFFHDQGRPWCADVRYVCSDMWRPYLRVIAKKLPNALNVLDRFHVVKKLSEAVDKVRSEEARELTAKGEGDVLKHTKYCFLKRRENLTDKQALRLKDVLRYRLKSVRAFLLKESFEAFWSYSSFVWARWFLNKWCKRAMRSRLAPFKKFVGTLRNHEELLMNWFKADKAFSSGVVEGLNRKVNLIVRRAYGYKNFDILRIELFHTMGHLPEPDLTRRFC